MNHDAYRDTYRDVYASVLLTDMFSGDDYVLSICEHCGYGVKRGMFKWDWVHLTGGSPYCMRQGELLLAGPRMYVIEEEWLWT